MSRRNPLRGVDFGMTLRILAASKHALRRKAKPDYAAKKFDTWRSVDFSPPRKDDAR